MSTTYAKKSASIQNVPTPSASSIHDSSSQSESLQRKADMTNNAAQRAEAPRPNNTGMPDNLKSGIESLSGFSMDDVRVHYNSSKPATVQALAYTQGTDIHVAPGQEKHLPHEAWHVAQQMAGRVSPTTNINGIPVNDNAGLEHEADVMGEKAVQCKQNQISITGDCLDLGNAIQCARGSQPNEMGLSEDGKRDADKAGVDIGRDHIIPYELIEKFIRCMQKFFSENNVEEESEIKIKWNLWIQQAHETKKENDPVSTEEDENISDLTGDMSLLWMPGNILISWKNRRKFGPSSEHPQFISDGDIDRTEDFHGGFDDYALYVAVSDPEQKKMYSETCKLMERVCELMENGGYPLNEIIRILDKLTEIASIKKVYETKPEDWVTVENPDYELAMEYGMKSQKNKQYYSCYQPVPGFRVRECGSWGNNCLLLSLGIRCNYTHVRYQVIKYERNQGRTQTTTLDSFLTPDTLFPVLRDLGHLRHHVWIYDMGDRRWYHWNGRAVVDTDIPHESAYGSNQIFLLYNGINHYQRLEFLGN